MAIQSASTLNASQAPKQPTIASVVADLDPVIGRLELAAQRVSGCGDRLLGVRPTDVEDSEKAPAPTSLVYALQEHRARLVKLADYLDSEVIRLESGLS